MINKRTLLRGGLISLLWGACKCSAASNEFGCSISIDHARSLLDLPSDAIAKKIEIVPRTGNQNFDRNAAKTLSFLCDLFNVDPAFTFFKKNSNNAFATSYNFFGKNDGTVLFGRDLLFDLQKKFDVSDEIFGGICAHEFGHIFQFKNRLNLDVGEENVRKSELHADFLSGYYAGSRKLLEPNFPAAVIAMSHESFGDFQFTSAQHHGTPAERAKAVVLGFETAYKQRIPLDSANKIGINFISSI